MIKYVLFFLFITPFSLNAQVTDIPCSAGEFYAMEGIDIRKLQLTGTTLTDLGIVASITGVNTAGLVYGNDIIHGTNNRTFYVTSHNFITGVHVIYQYNGTSWDTAAVDTTVYHNGGAFGTFVYFHHSKTTGLPNDQCISRLNPNGTLTKIFTDTTLEFSVADIIVNNQGHVFFFRGTAVGATTEFVEIDPSGNIINIWPGNLNNLSTLWGAALVNNIFYIGWNTLNNIQLFPLILTTGTATLGTPINWPVNNSSKDLANCYDPESTSLNETGVNNTISFYPNPSYNGEIILENAKEGMEISIFGAKGELIRKNIISVSGNYSFTIDKPGIYLALLNHNGVISGYRIIRM